MATKPKLTVNELMDSILAVDDDMTEEEAKAELKAAGFDIKKTEASLNNRFEQLRALAKRRKHLVVPQSACLLLAEEPCRHGARQAFCAECDSAREEPLRTEGGPTIQEQQENARRFK